MNIYMRKRDDLPLKKTESLRSICGVALVFLLLFIKSLIFYGQQNLGHYDIPFAFVTCAILLLLYLAIYAFAPRVAKVVLFVLYILSGLLMSIDSIYYAYVSKMPSAAMLGMAGQLDDVSTTIHSLIGWKQISPLMDLPLWFLYAVNRKRNKSFPRISKASVLAGGTGFCLLALTVVVTASGFKPVYLKNEFYCYHTYDIARTIASPIDEREVDKARYTVPADKDSTYYGLAEGKNLIVLQVEALQNFVLGTTYNGQVVTPNVNRLLGEDTLYFNNYYYQIGGGNTADAEFAVNNSLFGPENEAAYVKYADNDYYGLPWLLKENGYSGAYAFHGYYGDFWNRETAYIGQGFDDFFSIEDFDQNDMFPMGLSDRQLFTQSMDRLTTFAEPFYAFYVTVSSHHPYAIPLKDRGITLYPEDESTLFGLYMHSVNYVDTVIGEFLDMLKEAGLYDNSVIVIYGDHYALPNTDDKIADQVRKLTGEPYTIFDVFNVPLLIHIPGMGNAETIETAGGHVDLMPTLLNLLGLENDKTIMFGQNLLSASSGFVCEQTHMAQGSFISDDMFFSKPQNNIELYYSVYDKETMETLDPNIYADLSDLAYNRIKDCEALLARNDLLLSPSENHTEK